MSKKGASHNNKITHENITQSIKEWAQSAGIPYQPFYYLYKKWGISRALEKSKTYKPQRILLVEYLGETIRTTNGEEIHNGDIKKVKKWAEYIDCSVSFFNNALRRKKDATSAIKWVVRETRKAQKLDNFNALKRRLRSAKMITYV